MVGATGRLLTERNQHGRRLPGAVAGVNALTDTTTAEGVNMTLLQTIKLRLAEWYQWYPNGLFDLSKACTNSTRQELIQGRISLH